MNRPKIAGAALSALLALASLAPIATAQVPTDIMLPGTQPNEVSELESPNKCDNCHGGYDPAVEPARNWRGSMMAHSVRDPLFWATVAVSEQDFPGSGDLCIRCHSPEGWLGGRSSPTDGSGLKQSDAQGVMCDACHQMVDPTGLEHAGEQTSPFIANDGGNPVEGFYGSAMAVLSPTNLKFGPYLNAPSTHQSIQSQFHRSSNMCGTCHDVSNPVVGDLAHNHGAQTPLPGLFSGVPGSPVEGKAGFNNPPYAYGIVERTFSEHAAGLLSQMPVSDYDMLPAELQAGSIQFAHDAAVAAGPEDMSGNYADGTERLFSCQTCHMPPVYGKGCNKAGADPRDDLPLHDLTGGNTWVPAAIEYLDGQGDLLLGGGMSSDLLSALQAGAQRAAANLTRAAELSVSGNTARVVNLTGHKLISGYPEGRRMWLRVTWKDAGGGTLRVDGEYGSIVADVDGTPTPVDTLLDLAGANTRIWEAHFGMSQVWANQLLGLGYDGGLPLAYDRVTGDVVLTLDDVAALDPDEAAETFHFVINNTVLADNRIPPYGMDYDEAAKRNVLPVPVTQFGDPGSMGGGAFDYFDELELSPPPGAYTADLELLYQTTSWEYVQFLHLANTGASVFLADTGADVLDAWLSTGMAAPQVMDTATWDAPFVDCNGNGTHDAIDLFDGTSPDCNANGVPDECDLALGTSTDFDGDGQPDECQPLSVDTDVISLSAGGTQNFVLDAGPTYAGEIYWIIGSATGTSPGLPGPPPIPLNPDAYTTFLLQAPNVLIQGSLAFLDQDGKSGAFLTLNAGTDPTLAGIQLHHAYVVLTITPLAGLFASNAVPLFLAP